MKEKERVDQNLDSENCRFVMRKECHIGKEPTVCKECKMEGLNMDWLNITFTAALQLTFPL